MKSLVSLASNSPIAFATVRAMQDYFYNAYKLRKAHFIDEESWKIFERQIRHAWQSAIISDIRDEVIKTDAFFSY